MLYVFSFFSFSTLIFGQSKIEVKDLDFFYSKSDSICRFTKNTDFCKLIKFQKERKFDSCYVYSSKLLNRTSSIIEKDILNYIQGVSAINKGLTKKALSSFLSISDNTFFKNLKKIKLGWCYLNLKEYDEAITVLLEWEKNSSTTNARIKKEAFHDLGLSYLHKKEYIKAKEYFQKELNLVQARDTATIIRTKMDLANVYYNQYLDDEAIPLFKEAYELAKLFSDLELKQYTAKNMAVIEKNRKNYQKSVDYYIEYGRWKDSIWNRDKIWELTEKDKQLAVAQKQQEIVLQEEQLKRQAVVQKSLVIGASGLLVFLGFLGYFYRELRSKNRFITQQKEELNVANKTKDYLFSVVSHDLRSPINTIKRQHEKLKRQLKNKEYDAVSETTNNAIALTESTSHLLNNVLHWSLEQNNQLSFKAEEYPLKPLVEQAVYNFEEIAEAKNIVLTTMLEATILVKADKESLKIVLRNLLDNALKYTGENGEIAIKTYNDSEEFSTIEIKDTGFGISEEKLVKIKRLEDLSIDKINRSEGVGLGMLLCQTLIKKNNGKLLIDSELEVGTTIRILLPNASA
ncbi:tetratricopeptide repeat-containing sensor histidine kinase [Tenacibaculum mesophilum]|uniref:tetratricopeptide repeat-containing sensor histidine kinase n=1 Tax=Tenacibaculum mesophilum TaxID=104268 RepID=UPI00135A3BB1|nr:tetratricopeptide repeat-containing sensor histidine kinase [Tenacibaculum mesophilum]KAF9657981.1 tetratricopeptide repeat-containing sensor histidine kinase [Tenacibaculum mesophilum]